MSRAFLAKQVPGPSSAGQRVLAVLLVGLVLAVPALGFDLVIDGWTCPWDTVARFVLPGETLGFAVPGPDQKLGWAVDAGELLPAGSNQTRLVAPSVPGLYPLVVCGDSQLKLVNVFVMVPFDSLRDGELNGYRIGRYPSSTPFPNFVYPVGFVEVTADNIDTPVSPSYKLRDFVSRQPGSYPKYVVLREELVLKLELLAELVRQKGHEDAKLVVFSGYRTPAYHYRRGSGTNSAHIYGGAADVFVDSNNDGMMDDLNGDGSSDSRDSRLLASYVEELETLHPELVGGCGWYRRTRVRGPFIHTDVRGERTRWHR